MDKAPHKGALLQVEGDMKDNDDPLVNSNKGIGLPRVYLDTLAGDLGQTLDSLLTIEGTLDKDEHIGLMVYYGKGDYCSRTPIYRGPYLWTGSQWEYMGPSLRSPGLGVLVDDRPQKDGKKQEYLYHSFGPAGTWMLENMRYTDESMTLGVPSGRADSYATAYYCYPNVDLSNPTKEPKTWTPLQGYLYNYKGATLGTVLPGETLDGEIYQGHGEPDELINGQPIVIQGICPDGWHIPTDREWNELEKEIYENPNKYGEFPPNTVFQPAKWDEAWNTSFTGNGGPPRGADNLAENGYSHPAIMLSKCENVNGRQDRSRPIIAGGFNILAVGGVFINGRTDKVTVVKYADESIFMTVSKTRSVSTKEYTTIWTRTTSRSHSLHRTQTNRADLLSVRCKRDNP
ncbi:fibrobacter succinogenes major paralogous domain-containing protein [Dysgonomonas sp. 511]|uniref:fibrobacter succinogenes major paralogous domain-containing protein n=1 Tax=Dysgonomonas sp. 511 TaxID=2302930 RepID=UPI001C87B5A3